MPKWEYKRVEASRSLQGVRPDEEALGKLGDEGWELAGVIVEGDIDSVRGNLTAAGGTIVGGKGKISSTLVFKRPKA